MSVEKVRAKFYCSHNAPDDYREHAKRLIFFAVADDGSPENRVFATATPIGTIEMVVTTEVGQRFTVGEEYYLDFTPAES